MKKLVSILVAVILSVSIVSSVFAAGTHDQIKLQARDYSCLTAVDQTQDQIQDQLQLKDGSCITDTDLTKVKTYDRTRLKDKSCLLAF